MKEERAWVAMFVAVMTVRMCLVFGVWICDALTVIGWLLLDSLIELLYLWRWGVDEYDGETGLNEKDGRAAVTVRQTKAATVVALLACLAGFIASIVLRAGWFTVLPWSILIAVVAIVAVALFVFSPFLEWTGSDDQLWSDDFGG